MKSILDNNNKKRTNQKTYQLNNTLKYFILNKKYYK